jgi:hypothetical protein
MLSAIVDNLLFLENTEMIVPWWDGYVSLSF